MLKKCKANNAEAILHTRYKSIKFHGNLKNECILLTSWFDMELPNSYITASSIDQCIIG